jgi:hypothetical protein
MFMRQRLHSLAKVMVIAAPDFITDRHPAKADGFTRPPFAHLVAIHQMHLRWRDWIYSPTLALQNL